MKNMPILSQIAHRYKVKKKLDNLKILSYSVFIAFSKEKKWQLILVK
jgi:hypothetical protein